MTFEAVEEVCKVPLYHPTARLLPCIVVEDSESASMPSSKSDARALEVPAILAAMLGSGSMLVGVAAPSGVSLFWQMERGG